MFTSTEQTKTNLTSTYIHSISKKEKSGQPRQFIQPKLTVGAPDDVYEKEADAMADKVMRMPVDGSVSFSSVKNSAQRKCAHCEEEEKQVNRKESNTEPNSIAPPIVNEVINSGGKPLDPITRSFMEPRFNYDFSHVKIHDDHVAAKSADSINALAYTSGNSIVFNSGQYNTNSDSGKRLLAHELTHVVQQSSNVSTKKIQRDVAIEPPAVAPPVFPELTADEVKEAIRYNKDRYNEANTRLIQEWLGGPVTGVWSDENIESIANTQQEYGLKKDGKIGNTTFRFIDRNQRLSGASTRTEDCLVSFRLVGPDGQDFGRDDASHCHFRNHFRIEAQFSPRCNCSGFQYRQFIRGHLRRTRGGAVTDMPIREPGGVLPPAFIEDTDTAAAVPHYGHRDDAAEADPIDHYINAASTDDQANGCRFISDDTPGTTPGTTFSDCLAGDEYALLMSFRGEIQRNGNPIQQKFWTAINLPHWRP